MDRHELGVGEQFKQHRDAGRVDGVLEQEPPPAIELARYLQNAQVLALHLFGDANRLRAALRPTGDVGHVRRIGGELT